MRQRPQKGWPLADILGQHVEIAVRRHQRVKAEARDDVERRGVEGRGVHVVAHAVAEAGGLQPQPRRAA